MNNQPCIILHCISLQRDNEPKLILDYLNDFVKKNWPMTHVFLESTQPYWKDETERVLIYNVSYVDHLSVHDFISHFNIFNIHREYISSYVNDVIKHQTVTKEKAIWSKLCYEDMFSYWLMCVGYISIPGYN